MHKIKMRELYSMDESGLPVKKSRLNSQSSEVVSSLDAEELKNPSGFDFAVLHKLSGDDLRIDPETLEKVRLSLQLQQQRPPTPMKAAVISDPSRLGTLPGEVSYGTSPFGQQSTTIPLRQPAPELFRQPPPMYSYQNRGSSNMPSPQATFGPIPQTTTTTNPNTPQSGFFFGIPYCEKPSHGLFDPPCQECMRNVPCNAPKRTGFMERHGSYNGGRTKDTHKFPNAKPWDPHYNLESDRYFNIRGDQPKTTLGMLPDVRMDFWPKVSQQPSQPTLAPVEPPPSSPLPPLELPPSTPLPTPSTSPEEWLKKASNPFVFRASSPPTIPKLPEDEKYECKDFKALDDFVNKIVTIVAEKYGGHTLTMGFSKSDLYGVTYEVRWPSVRFVFRHDSFRFVDQTGYSEKHFYNTRADVDSHFECSDALASVLFVIAKRISDLKK